MNKIQEEHEKEILKTDVGIKGSEDHATITIKHMKGFATWVDLNFYSAWYIDDTDKVVCIYNYRMHSIDYKNYTIDQLIEKYIKTL